MKMAMAVPTVAQTTVVSTASIWTTSWWPMSKSGLPGPPSDGARNDAGADGADHAADAVHAEGVERVVIAELRLPAR